jgi:sporulation protein YabP
MPYEELSAMQHRLELDGRERLVVSGVEEVERFDEEEIVMATTAGTLVGGEQLHIGKLNLDGGELHVDGSIHTLLYEDKTSGGGQGGFLRRLFG